MLYYGPQSVLTLWNRNWNCFALSQASWPSHTVTSKHGIDIASTPGAPLTASTMNIMIYAAKSHLYQNWNGSQSIHQLQQWKEMSTPFLANTSIKSCELRNNPRPFWLSSRRNQRHHHPQRNRSECVCVCMCVRVCVWGWYCTEICPLNSGWWLMIVLMFITGETDGFWFMTIALLINLTCFTAIIYRTPPYLTRYNQTWKR